MNFLDKNGKKIIPVYMINGFLDSGKSGFIGFTLAQPYFQIKGKTLLLLCEEGENEYDERLLKKSRTEVELIEDEADFTCDRLTELEKKHKPERIIIEFNGMWNCKDIRLPVNWKVEQQITTIDGSTFPVYYTNMRSLLAEMIRGSEMIIFNRCDTVRDQLNTYKRNIKAVNPQADVIFEDANGEIDEIFEDDLPYDLNQETIVLDNQGYGIWYLDSMDHPERYIGKKLQFVAMVLKPDNFPKGYFVPGRMAMTCCADDMAFIGYACEYAGAASLKQKQWIKVTATVTKGYFEDYKGEGPILHALSIEETKAPRDEVISFT
ncbi:MAG: GTP-binding protein [Acetatifactor sp.]